MRVLSLLFDPRGVIDRRAFWSGLIQLTIVSLAVWWGLMRLDSAWALTAPPIVGEAFAIGGVVAQVYGAALPDVALMTALGVVAARLYAAACLMLKRSRDAGLGARPLIVFGLTSLAVHALLGLWAYDLFDDDMAVIVPLIADVAVTALIWAAFLILIGARPTRPRKIANDPVEVGPG
jgi:uncharacterized membrane protein YhaH (DUF805 family)